LNEAIFCSSLLVLRGFLIQAFPFYDSRPIPFCCADGAASTRREIISKTLMAGAAMAAPAISNAYTVPDLPYAYDALEPYVDAPTMKFHHDKHHATYVANINNYMDGKDEPPILDLMADALEAGPVRNSGGGHYNHAFFWEEMTSPDKAKKSKVSDQLAKLIDSSFGSMDEMKAKFEAQAAPGAVFGSGWVWVVVNNAGDKLEIVGMSRI
jgi:Fe-Mn family superoxide dismutase